MSASVTLHRFLCKYLCLLLNYYFSSEFPNISVRPWCFHWKKNSNACDSFNPKMLLGVQTEDSFLYWVCICPFMFVLERQGYMCQAYSVHFLAKLQSEKQAYLRLFLLSNVGARWRAVLAQILSDMSRQARLVQEGVIQIYFRSSRNSRTPNCDVLAS